MELRQLEYFVAVAEELHFGRAADRLHIGQPAVSQQIRRLEREVRADLFDRSARRIRLTAAGQRLLPAAREVLAAAERAHAVAAGLAPDAGRTLRLGTSTGLGEHLERVLAQLADRAPRLTVELVAAPAVTRLAQLADGRLDAAFVRGEVAEPGLRVIPVWQDRLLAVLPRGHRLAAGPEVALADLAELPLRLPLRRDAQALVDLVTSACHRAGFEPRPAAPSSPLPEMLAAIGTGSPAWTVLYESHARMLRAGRAAFVPFRQPGLAITTGIAVRAGSPPPDLDVLLAACAGSVAADQRS